MTSERDMVVAAVGRKAEVVELLERNLGNHDQAWVVCEYTDCVHHISGRCTIYMVHNVPRMVPGKPCSSYEKRL